MERIFEAPNGIRVIAVNDIQADVFEREGFKEVTEDKKKK
jgi:hypothetical protein